MWYYTKKKLRFENVEILRALESLHNSVRFLKLISAAKQNNTTNNSSDQQQSRNYYHDENNNHQPNYQYSQQETHHLRNTHIKCVSDEGDGGSGGGMDSGIGSTSGSGIGSSVDSTTATTTPTSSATKTSAAKHEKANLSISRSVCYTTGSISGFSPIEKRLPATPRLLVTNAKYMMNVKKCSALVYNHRIRER